MGNDSKKALIKKLSALQTQLGDKSNDFPLWRSLNDAMGSLMSFVNLEYIHKPTDEQIQSASEYPKKIERLKKYLKTHPMGNKEKESLIYGN